MVRLLVALLLVAAALAAPREASAHEVTQNGWTTSATATSTGTPWRATGPMDRILNSALGFYVFSADLAYRIANDEVIRFHWGHVAMNS